MTYGGGEGFNQCFDSSLNGESSVIVENIETVWIKLLYHLSSKIEKKAKKTP